VTEVAVTEVGVPVQVKRLRIGRDGIQVRLTLSDDSEYTLHIDAVTTLGLRVEAPVNEGLRAKLEDHQTRYRAREAALRLLAVRPRSRRELQDRLRRKEIPAGIIRDVLDRLVELRLLNDADFARALVRDRLRLRPKGRRALSAELARKGVAREVSDEVMDEIFAEMETSEAEVADRVAAGWLKRQPSKTRTALFEGPRSEAGAKAWRRGLGHLARKGFGGGLARTALDRALKDRAALDSSL